MAPGYHVVGTDILSTTSLYFLYCLQMFMLIIYSHFIEHEFSLQFILGGHHNGPPAPQQPGFHAGQEPFAPDVEIPPFPQPVIVLDFLTSSISYK